MLLTDTTVFTKNVNPMKNKIFTNTEEITSNKRKNKLKTVTEYLKTEISLTIKFNFFLVAVSQKEETNQ